MRRHVLDQTWNRNLAVSDEVSRVGPVSTAPVRIIGTDAKPANFGKTKRYPSILPSHEDCIPQPDSANHGRDWRVLSAKDVSFLADDSDALAFAPTMPAISLEELGIEDSGVHEVGRLRLALDPRDSAPDEPAEPLTPTLRLRPLKKPPLKRVWQRWEQQSPLITIGTAAAFCLLSAFLVSLLAP